jgi:hypothetical protein
MDLFKIRKTEEIDMNDEQKKEIVFDESKATESETSPEVFGEFFIFSDLSVRTEGAYRLKFSLFDRGLTPNSIRPIERLVWLPPFRSKRVIENT